MKTNLKAKMMHKVNKITEKIYGYEDSNPSKKVPINGPKILIKDARDWFTPNTVPWYSAGEFLESRDAKVGCANPLPTARGITQNAISTNE